MLVLEDAKNINGLIGLHDLHLPLVLQSANIQRPSYEGIAKFTYDTKKNLMYEYYKSKIKNFTKINR